MMRIVLNIIATLTRAVWEALKLLFRGVRGLLFAMMIALNIAMVAVPAVYDAVASVFWRVVAIGSETYALQAETRAGRRANLDQVQADLEYARQQEVVLLSERNRLISEREVLDRRLVQVEADRETQGCSVLMIWAVAVIGVQRQPPWPVGGLGFA